MVKPRFRLHDDENHMFMEFDMPDEWRPAPDVLRLPFNGGADDIFFTRRGIQDGIHYYWPARVRTIPETFPAPLLDAAKWNQYYVRPAAAFINVHTFKFYGAGNGHTDDVRCTFCDVPWSAAREKETCPLRKKVIG